MEKRIERIEIDKRVIGLMEKSPEKFIDEFCSVLNKYRRDSDAYEHVEKILMDNIGIRRFKNYNTFRVIKNNFIK